MIKYISWIGTASSVIGSFLVALGLCKIGFLLFIIGAVSWGYIGIKTRDIALYTLNGFFMVANFIGLYRAFL